MWLYSLSLGRGDFPHWVVLYCQDNVHFQLGTLRSLHAGVSRSVFAASQVPQWLMDHYSLCNSDSPYGSAYTGGVA